jgi:hypothetical protein
MGEKITYKDFEIGQKVILTGTGCDQDKEYFYNIYLTLGKEYEITDLDFHFPDKICIKRDNGHGAFMDIKYFDNISIVREKNIDKLLKD